MKCADVRKSPRIRESDPEACHAEGRLREPKPLLRRRDDETTWMEIYENVEDGTRFEGELAKLVERHGLAGLLVPGSSRKQEVFRAF